jgi:hypothetical protein
MINEAIKKLFPFNALTNEQKILIAILIKITFYGINLE